MSESASGSTDILSQIDSLLLEEEQDLEPEVSEDQVSEEGTPTEETTEEAETETEEEPLTWAKALKVDDDKIVVDENGDLLGINVKVDGKIETVELPDLIAGYQTTKDYTQKTQALAEQRREFESIRNQALQEYTKKLDTAEELTKYLQQSIYREFQQVDWQNLRNQNPAEYAAMVQDYQLKQAEVEKTFQALKFEREQEQARLQEQNGKLTQEYIQNQVNHLLTKNPEWKNPEVFKSAVNDMSNFLNSNYGFDPNDIMQIQDARIYEVIKDAMAFRNGKQVAEKKLAKPMPKFQKTTGVQVKTTTNLDKLTQAAKKATGYSKRHVQAAAIDELLKGVM